MADMNNRSGGGATSGENRYPNLTTEELQIIGYFAKGQRHSISSPALRLECTETSIRLVNGKGKLIGISKQTNEWQRKVLINSNSSYTSSIVEILTDLGFVTKQKSSHPDFTEHHYYQVPAGYKLNHTDVLQLWKVWWNNKQYQLNPRNRQIDVLVFSKGNWCLVQDLQPKQGNFILKTDRGELTILSEDFVVWIDKSAPEAANSKQSLPVVTNQVSSVPTPPVQTPLVGVGEAFVLAEGSPLENLPSAPTTPTEVMTDRSAPTFQPSAPIVAKQIDSEQTIDLPEPEEELDLEAYLSTFNTEDTEDIDRIEGIYNIEELLNSTIVAPEVAPAPARTRTPFKLEVTVVEPAAEKPASASEPPIGKPQPTPTVVIPASKPPVARVEQPPVSNPVATVQIPAPSIADRKRSLKIKAVNTLTNNLKNGVTVTTTEVLKNGQGRVMNRKTTTVQQGCPGWTVEQIKQLQDELAEI